MLYVEIVMRGTDPADVANTTLVLLSGMVSMWAVFAGWPLVVARRIGQRVCAVVGPWTTPGSRVRLVAASVGLAVALRVASIGLDVLAARLGWDVQGNSSWMATPRDAWATAAILLGAAVLGPIAEELFFRGLAMRSLMATLQRRWGAAARRVSFTAVALSALAFGLPHGSTIGADGALTSPLSASGLYVVTQTALIGAAFGILAMRRGLLAACAAHVTFNSLGVMLILIGVAS
ncbi:CPBP family intramembrane metalloprotease [Cellulomonas hominis]|nr:CPBP family intramembrane metalloprotease [Cellulomonas hominis]